MVAAKKARLSPIMTISIAVVLSAEASRGDEGPGRSRGGSEIGGQIVDAWNYRVRGIAVRDRPQSSRIGIL